MTIHADRIRFPHYIGLGLISLAILMLELTLTRIFSVTMWYHFAFVAISVALFGISASGLMVFLFKKTFAEERLEKQLCLFSFLMSLSIVVTLLVVLRVGFIPKFSMAGIVSSAIIYGASTLPFFFGGLCISLLLLHHADRVSGLYFFDLFGASLGCILTLIVSNTFPGPKVVLLASAVATAASLCFCIPRAAHVLALAFRSGFVIVLVFLVLGKSDRLTRISAVKSAGKTAQRQELAPIFEKWNSFSRVAAFAWDAPFSWGLSSAYKGNIPQQMVMTIDASAATPMVNFKGDFEEVEYLKYDITSLVHWLKDSATVLIIGPGGGRDVLTSLTFEQSSVVGVEINPIIVKAVNDEFRDFVGNIYDHPDVEIHVDEGRSYLSRSDEQYDIIQASMVDTWAATSSGAFALTENNLYTMEAFIGYLNHLEDDGMLTFSRWYFEKRPAEALRLAVLGIESLESIGTVDPRRNVLIAKSGHPPHHGISGIVTLVLKKTPFTLEEIQTADEVCRDMNFQTLVSPTYASKPLFAEVFDKSKRERLFREYPLDISPPTDDKPFFFHMVPIRSLFSRRIGKGIMDFNLKAVIVLGNLFLIAVVLALLFLISPFFLQRPLNTGELLSNWRHLLYFSLIGFGFMMIEIPVIQQLMLFLGHPIYSLSVVLLAILLFSSLGSLSTRRISPNGVHPFLKRMMLLLVPLLFVYLFLLPYVVHTLISIPTSLKIIFSIALVAPLGFLMGMPFPLGIKAVPATGGSLIPWCWSVNGAFSVLATVASIVVAINFGFTVAMALGGAAYAGILLLTLTFGSTGDATV